MNAIWDILTRLILTAAIFAIFWYILKLIVFENITGTTRDLLFIIIGAFLTAFGKVIDYWFSKNHKE